MPIIVAPATDGAKGFDTQTALTPATAADFKSLGFQFCVRYLSRNQANHVFHQGNGTPDISAAETQAILGAGLALMAVQHVAPGAWAITPGLGTANGQAAAGFATAGGILPGTTVWLDLESLAVGTAPADIMEYCNDWFAAVSAGGFDPGLYVGFDTFLSPAQLYSLNTTHYWRAMGNIPAIATRGYQMTQGPEAILAGVNYETDTIVKDALGGVPNWMVE